MSGSCKSMLDCLSWFAFITPLALNNVTPRLWSCALYDFFLSLSPSRKLLSDSFATRQRQRHSTAAAAECKNELGGAVAAAMVRQNVAEFD